MNKNQRITKLNSSNMNICEAGHYDDSRPRSFHSKSLEMKEMTSISADYETAISKAGFGRFNYMVYAVSFIASSLPAIATSVLSYVLPVATCDLELSPFNKGMLNVSTFFGMTVSGFLWGLLSDSIGRKRLMTAGFILDSAIIIAASLSGSFWLMVIFKFLDGFVISGPFSIFMTYISEVFSSERRMLIVLSTGLFTSIGSIVQSVFAWLVIPGPSHYHLFWHVPLRSWRLFMLCGFLPVFLCGIGSLFFVESPKFLLEKGRNEEALEALRRIYSINTGLSASSYPVHYLFDSKIKQSGVEISAVSPKSKLLSALRESFTIFGPPYGFVVLQFCFYQVVTVLGLNVTRLWLPQLLSDLDSNTNNATSGQTLCESISKPAANFDLDVYCKNLVLSTSLFVTMMILYSSYLVSQIIFLSTVSHVGKKLYATVTVTIAAIAFAVLPNVPVSYFMIPSLFAVGSLNVTYFCLLGTIVEVFPTLVRATSLSSIITMGRLGTVITNLFVSSLFYTHCVYVYYAVCALSAVSAIGSFFMPIEPLKEVEEETTK